MVLFNADKAAPKEMLKKDGEIGPNIMMNRKTGARSKIHEEHGLPSTIPILVQARRTR